MGTNNKTSKITIVLVEDNQLLREGITALINKQPNMQVVAGVENEENLVDIISKHGPDITLIYMVLKSSNSLDVVKTIKDRFEEIKIIVMDLVPFQENIYEFVQAGVSGFTVKDVNTTEFFETINSVHEGKKVLPASLINPLFDQIVKTAIHHDKPLLVIETVQLSKREREVIKYIAEGCTNKEIAQKLHLSPYTIKSHVHNILDKLKLRTRIQIANFAHKEEAFKKAIEDTSLLD